MEDRFRYDGKRVLVVGCYSGMGGGCEGGLVARRRGAWCRLPGSRLRAGVLHAMRPPGSRGHRRRPRIPLGTDRPALLLRGAPQTRPAPEVFAVNFAAMRHVVEGVHPHIPKGGAVAIISSNAGLQFIEHMRSSWRCSVPTATTARAGRTRTPTSSATATRCRRRRSSSHDEARHRCRRGRRPRNCISLGPTATPMMPEFEKAAGAEFIAKFNGPMDRQAQPEEQAGPGVPEQRCRQLRHRVQRRRRRWVPRRGDDRRHRRGQAGGGGRGSAAARQG